MEEIMKLATLHLYIHSHMLERDRNIVDTLRAGILNFLLQEI